MEDATIEKLDPKIQEGIDFFEELIKSVPRDRVALEYLAMAYALSGERDKQRDILIRLVDIALFEHDYEHANILSDLLAQMPETPRIAAVLERVKIMTSVDDSDKKTEKPDANADETDITLSGDLDLDSMFEEAAVSSVHLVKIWKERAWLDETTAQNLIQELSVPPTVETKNTVSALIALNGQMPELVDGILNVMCEELSIPVIPLDCFDCKEFAQSMPKDFMILRGAVPFAKLGTSFLVAILNPFDGALKKKISSFLDSRCFFYLAHPVSMEKTLNELFAEKTEEVKK